MVVCSKEQNWVGARAYARTHCLWFSHQRKLGHILAGRTARIIKRYMLKLNDFSLAPQTLSASDSLRLKRLNIRWVQSLAGTRTVMYSSLGKTNKSRHIWIFNTHHSRNHLKKDDVSFASTFSSLTDTGAQNAQHWRQARRITTKSSP